MSTLATVNDVKVYLGISAATDDTLLQSLVVSESAFIESWLNRTFSIASQIDIFSGSGGQEHVFNFYPVISVSSLTIESQSIPSAATINDRGYMLYDNRLLLFGYTFGWGRRTCMVEYVAGYATIPYDIRQACVELVSIRYKEKDRVGLNSKALAGETTSFNVKDMPDHVKTILKQYRNVVPI